MGVLSSSRPEPSLSPSFCAAWLRSCAISRRSWTTCNCSSGASCRRASIRDGGTARQLQHFDSLGQTLSAIADFAEALSGDAPPEWLLNPHSASRAVLLSDLAARLVSHLEAPPEAGASVAGELEFF